MRTLFHEKEITFMRSSRFTVGCFSFVKVFRAKINLDEIYKAFSMWVGNYRVHRSITAFVFDLYIKIVPTLLLMNGICGNLSESLQNVYSITVFIKFERVLDWSYLES